MPDGERSGFDGVVDLIGAVYDAALDAELWPEVLNRIGDAVGGPEVIFGIYDPSTGLSNLLAPRIDPARLRKLMDWAPHNPLLPLGIDQAPGKIFTVGSFMPTAQFTSMDFYNEWWLPGGYNTEPLTTNLLVDNGANGIFTIHGSVRRSPFDNAEKRLFAAMAQHLVRAIALQRHLYHLTFASESAFAGFDDLHRGFLLVDTQARPVFVNRAGRALLDARDGLRLEAGILSAPNADDARDLHALIASCALEGAIAPGGEIHLRRQSGCLPLHALVTPIRQQRRPRRCLGRSRSARPQSYSSPIPKPKFSRASKPCANASASRQPKRRSRLRSSRATAGRPPPTGSALPSGQREVTCPASSTRPAPNVRPSWCDCCFGSEAWRGRWPALTLSSR